MADKYNVQRTTDKYNVQLLLLIQARYKNRQMSLHVQTTSSTTNN